MNKNIQSKNETPKNPVSPSKNTEAIKALFEALGECCAKPAYDYQRIIVCLTRASSRVTAQCGAVFANPLRGLDPRGDTALVVVDKEEDWSSKMLDTVVQFVNQTRGVVVLMAAAESLARWHEVWRLQADQIRRRTHITIEFDM
ncbi:MAG TPA: hypothetical protein VH619_17075 [Verrucomicrobiae bacterium]|jgi:hypothetical protein|nr:hypothetical protein [Verrucomicrobiae bacterium]